MTSRFSIEQSHSICRVAALVFLNAMIFQEILSERDNRVRSVENTLRGAHLASSALYDHWTFIIARIDYYPIFHLASELVLTLTANKYTQDALEGLAKAAADVVRMRAALRHDLIGRVYHRLLADAKYLGTYYTAIPSAALLLRLALRPTAWQTEWHDLEALRKFRVADLACGTGTLLMAAADALADNYVGAAAARGKKVDLETLQTTLAEHVLHGYDVLPTAIHLTASTVALRAPDVGFERMNLFSLPLGGDEHRLGSVEFLKGGSLQMPMDLFGAAPKTRQVTGKAMEELPSATLPAELNLCVMNPPFTRSVGGNLLFGSAPEAERVEMQKRLKKLVQKPEVMANVTAGLGSVFVAAADLYVKRPGGRIALVLPKALLSGVAWRETRALINTKYRIEFLVASHDPERWNFSESTDLSEVLLVASKVNSSLAENDAPAVAVNLWRNPPTSFEALAIARALSRETAPDIADGQGALEIFIGKQKAAEAVALRWGDWTQRPHWLLPCAFAQSDLIRAAFHLERGALWLPGYGRVGKVPLCPLDELGTLGPDARDIHDAFRLSRTATAYPAFWGHDASRVLTMAQSPNNYLSPLSKPKAGRHLRKVEDIWPLSGQVLLAERLRLNSQRLAAVRLSKPVLSSTWWEFSFKRRVAKQKEKTFILWLNSTLGLLLLLANREETQGAWVKFKKPVLAALPVLNLQKLSSAQLKQLAATYDRLTDAEFKPLSAMDSDAARAEIDASIAEALKLPDFSILRERLAQEPVVCMKRLA